MLHASGLLERPVRLTGAVYVFYGSLCFISFSRAKLRLSKTISHGATKHMRGKNLMNNLDQVDFLTDRSRFKNPSIAALAT